MLKFAAFLGTLTMYLDKEAYERAGLVGKPYGPKGSRKLKPRWGMQSAAIPPLLTSR